TVDAIGLFKSETKDTFLKIRRDGENFHVECDKGINPKKMDKGCLIFNHERENGFVVKIIDNTNRTEAQYWTDDFLHIKQRQDKYFNTHNVMSMYKTFVTKELPQQFEVSKADQADLLNRSMKFFKENENFEMQNFADKVIGQPEVIEQFQQFKTNFANENDFEIPDSFDISDSAVKKQSRAFKSIIKLDKNFHIYVHGNRELIEQGEDERGKFYKVYYKQEE
ncbi:MAG: nucleoid-associated protein, partial [Bacteroidales bacterium]|nr:nucleoid-associated protein [Bacteroidales bacterium]